MSFSIDPKKISKNNINNLLHCIKVAKMTKYENLNMSE